MKRLLYLTLGLLLAAGIPGSIVGAAWLDRQRDLQWHPELQTAYTGAMAVLAFTCMCICGFGAQWFLKASNRAPLGDGGNTRNAA